MTRLLFDTTFLVDSERTGSDLDDVIDDDDDVRDRSYHGWGAPRGCSPRQPPAQGCEKHAYVEDIIATIPVLNYDVDVAEAHAALLAVARSQGKPRGAHDLIIAATAKAFDRTVVSRDLTAFRDLPSVEMRSR